MLTMSAEQQENWDVALEINRTARQDPGSPYAGKYIAVAQQQVIAIEDNLDDLHLRLNALGDVAQEAIWIEASADYDRTYFIWQSLERRR